MAEFTDTQLELEKKVTKHAQRLGWRVRKVVFLGRKGAPDRWFFAPGGRLLIVEFKAPGGGVLSFHQNKAIRWLRAFGLVNRPERGVQPCEWLTINHQTNLLALGAFVLDAAQCSLASRVAMRDYRLSPQRNRRLIGGKLWGCTISDHQHNAQLRQNNPQDNTL
jgi:hypothetical protein